jgi:hypothetical protein
MGTDLRPGCDYIRTTKTKGMDMAQALVVVCDVCGRPAVETVSLKVTSQGYQKDVCQVHLDELIKGARSPRRGRPRTKPVVSGARSGSKRTTSAKRKTAKRTTAKRTARKKAS